MTFTQENAWNLKGLFYSYGIAAVLVVSYIWPLTRAFWDFADAHVAFALNSLVETSPTQQLFWAFMNLRVSDYIAAVVLFTVLATYVVRGAGAPARVRLARAILAGVMLLVLVTVTREFLFKDVSRDSPSLVLEPFTVLSEHVSLDVKDHSNQSFPGDHATVLATFTFLLWFFAGWRYGLASAVLAVFFVLPRLVSGAHWFTDVTIGGVVTALVTVPLVVHTPAQEYLVSALLRFFVFADRRQDEPSKSMLKP